MPNKRISELTIASSALPVDFFPIVQGGITKQITKENFTKEQSVKNLKEEFFDNGTITTGVFAPNCDVNGNNHLVTVAGNITINAPIATLTAGQSIFGIIEIVSGMSNTITWSAEYDWGSAGAPSLYGVSIVGFYRKFGDTKTKAFFRGGFA